jgi:hypothetical protein
MFIINFDYSVDYISIELNIKDSVENIVFYVFEDSTKIFIKHSDNKVIKLKKTVIAEKKVRFQFYWEKKSVKSNIRTEEISFNPGVNRRLFSTLISPTGYDKIKEEGYFSVDKVDKVEINDDIKWVTQHHNFNFTLNAWRFLNFYWGRFLKNYEFKVLKEIVSIVVQYYKYINSDKSKGNRFIWYDMAVGIRAIHITLLLHFKKFLSDEQECILNNLYQSHLEKLLDRNFLRLNNHGIWQLYGLRALLYARNDINKVALNYFDEEFNKLFDFSFNSEGVHVENSPFYHQYVANLFKAIPKEFLPSSNNKIDIIINNTDVSSWLSEYNNMFFQIGDTEGISKSSLEPNKQLEDFKIGDLKSYSKVYYKSGYFINKLFNVHGACESEFVFYNTSDSYIHKHFDSNSFILINRGIEIFSDGGKYIYDYSDLRNYFLSFDAHNTVFLKNKKTSLESLNLEKTSFQSFDKKDGSYRLTSLASYNGYMDHIREINYLPLKNLEIIDKAYNYEGDLVINFLFGVGIEIVDCSVEGFMIVQYKGRVVAKILLQKNFLDYKVCFGLEDPYKGWISKQYSVIEPTNSLQLIYPKHTNKVVTQISLY